MGQNRIEPVFMALFDFSGWFTIFGVCFTNIISSHSPIGIMIIWSIVFWIQLAYEFSAWRKLIEFIKENIHLLPAFPANYIRDGIKKFKLALIWIILPYFYINFIIGLILAIIGYHKIDQGMKAYSSSNYIHSYRSTPYHSEIQDALHTCML